MRVCARVCVPFSLESLFTFFPLLFKSFLSFATGVPSYLDSVVVLKHGHKETRPTVSGEGIVLYPDGAAGYKTVYNY